jgi:hypothetical protein
MRRIMALQLQLIHLLFITRAMSSSESSLSSSFSSLSLSSSPGVTKRQLFHESNLLILSSLDHLLSTVSDPLPPPAKPLTSQDLSSYGEALSHHMTKFVLFLSNLPPGDDPEPSLFIPLAEDLTKFVTALICSLRSLLSTARETQAQFILSITDKILQSIRSDIVSVDKQLCSSKSSSFSTKEIGLVYEALKALSAVPLTNSTAIGRSLNSFLNLIKDLNSQINEIREVEINLFSSSPAYEDEDEEFDDDQENDFSHQDYKIVPSIRDLIQFAFVITRKIYFLLLKFKISDENEKGVEWMEKQLKLVKKVSEKLDVMGAEVFPPQNIQKLNQGAMDVIQVLTEIVVELREFALLLVDNAFVEHLEEKEKVWDEKDETALNQLKTCQICKSWEEIIGKQVEDSKQNSECYSIIQHWAIKYIAKLHQIHCKLNL